MNGKSRPFGRPSQLTPMSSPDKTIVPPAHGVVGLIMSAVTELDLRPRVYGPVILIDGHAYRHVVGSEDTLGYAGNSWHLVVRNIVAVRDDGLPYGSPSPANQKALRAAHGRALRKARRFDRGQR